MLSRNTRLTFVLVFILLASLSCQLLSFGQSDATEASPVGSPTSVATAAATAELPPTQPGSAETPSTTETQPVPSVSNLPTLPPAQPGPETLDLAGLPEVLPINDHRERLLVVMDFTDTDGAPQQMITDYNFRQTSVPENAWYKFFEDNNPFLSQKVESALVGGQGYTVTDTSTCQVVTVEVVDNSGQRQPFTDLIKALTGQVSLSEAGVTVGEQQADAYPLDLSNLVPGSQVEIQVTTSDDSGTSTSTTTIQLTEEDSDLVGGKLYLARQGGYLLKLELQYSRVAGEEDAFLVQTGTTMNRLLTYEVVPALAVEPIQPPEGCAGLTGGSDGNANDDNGNDDNGNDNGNDNGDDTGGSGDVSINDIPRLTDAANVVQAGETLIYQTSQDMQSVLDFYRDELEAAGWEVTDEINLGTLASMELVRGSQTLSVTLTQSVSDVMVTIVLE
ncbi:MAG: hypothetical protein A2Z16_09850 [Chloroflexi bacterium RBG_16_54_18]|nr:MAG: hypothetical protein A2Z16_09850 [Chloroflexi bacterium RBG_16_54_18]